MNDTRTRDLLGLGLLQPRVPMVDSLRSVHEVGPDAAARILARHKVRRIARKRIAEAMARGSAPAAAMLTRLDAEILRLGAARERRVTRLEHQLSQLRQHAPDLAVRLMKGLGVRLWYPAGLPRDVGDADLWVPDLNAGLLLVGALRGQGYVYEPGEMPWLKRDLAGVLFGQVRMQHPDPDRFDVDVHIGPYSVRYCGLVTFSASADAAHWQPLSREDNLLAVIANAAGDCFIDAKTVNDITIAVSGPLDLVYVTNALRSSELHGFANSMLDVVTAVMSLDDRQSAALGRLRTGTTAEDGLGLAAEPDADLRTRLVTAHTRSVVARLMGDADAAERIADEARIAYGSPRSFRLRTSGGAPIRVPELNPWTCLRLAPQQLVRRLCGRTDQVPAAVHRRTYLADELELLECDAGDLLRFRDDIFLPTLDYLFCHRLVVAAPVDVGTRGSVHRSAR